MFVSLSSSAREDQHCGIGLTESLIGREFMVYSIIPKQLDRYRGRFRIV